MNPLGSVEAKQTMAICFLLAGLLSGVVLIVVAVKKKSEGLFSSRVPLRKLPKSLLIPAILALSFTLLHLWSSSPVTDKQGFGFSSFMLTLKKHEGLPIREEPSDDSRVLRLTEHFETYSEGGKAGRFTRVRMSKDNLIGWIESEKLEGGSFAQLKRDLSSSLRVFVHQYEWPKLVIDVLFGIFLSGLLLLLLGKRRGEKADNAITIATIAITTASVAFLHLSPIGARLSEARRVEEATSYLAHAWAAIFPAALSSFLGQIAFNKPRVKYVGELVAMLFILYLFWFGYGSVSGWDWSSLAGEVPP